MTLRVPGRLRPRIFLTFGTTRVVGRQPCAPAAFTPGEIHGTHFQGLSLPQGTWFCRKEPQKKSPVTPPGIDPGTVRLVAQRFNHYATPGPLKSINSHKIQRDHLFKQSDIRDSINSVISNINLKSKTQFVPHKEHNSIHYKEGPGVA